MSWSFNCACVGLRKRDSTLNELHSFGQVAYAGKCARVMMFDLFSPRPMWTPTPKVTVVNYMTRIESILNAW